MDVRISNAHKKIPVVLDTDIGTDIDDTWALAMMLKSPELDVRLIVTDTGDTTYRAKIVAKMLEIGGRTDVSVGIGVPLGNAPATQAPWVGGYEGGARVRQEEDRQGQGGDKGPRNSAAAPHAVAQQ